MSRAHVQSLPVNRRELSYYFLFVTILLFIGSITVASLWMLLSSDSDWVSIGAVYKFPPAEQPYLKKIYETPGEDPLRIWVVNIDGEITLFHAHTTYIYDTEVCPIAWNGANMRFEGPCWGSKFRLDGTLVDGPAKRDLDRFEFKIRNDELIVNKFNLIPGTCRKISYSRWKEPGKPPICAES